MPRGVAHLLVSHRFRMSHGLVISVIADSKSGSCIEWVVPSQVSCMLIR